MVSVTSSLPPLIRGNPTAQTALAGEQKLVLQPSLTLLVFILLPCIVLMFLVNCYLFFHRHPVVTLKKRSKRRGGVSRGNNPSYMSNQAGHSRPKPNYPYKSPCDCYYGAINKGLEATLALDEGAHVSFDRLQTPREWSQKQNETPVRPCYLRQPHVASVPCCPSRAAISRDRGISWNDMEDDGGSGMFYSEEETEQNAAPPNTPVAPGTTPGMMTPKVKFCHKTSTQRRTLGTPFTPLGSILFDHARSIPTDITPVRFSGNSSHLGPGLDSDFGISAGISLHILSSDSDSGSQSWASGMEWDYYDPCYMRKNRLRKENRQSQHIPVICSKQYWV